MKTSEAGVSKSNVTVSPNIDFSIGITARNNIVYSVVGLGVKGIGMRAGCQAQILNPRLRINLCGRGHKGGTRQQYYAHKQSE